tara:strand:- start:452 stop:643 length:192 start_codon:yes stop_codon:yes gene_type:complete
MGRRSKEAFLKNADSEYHKNIRVLSKRFHIPEKSKDLILKYCEANIISKFICLIFFAGDFTWL